MDNDLSVLLKVILDSSGIGSGDISKIQKILEKYTVNVAAELDKTQLINSVKQVLPQVIKEISKLSGTNIKIDIDDSLIEKSIDQVIQDGKRLEQELSATAQRVNKIQLSMTDKSVPKDNYELQVKKLTEQLRNLGLTDEEVAQKTKVLTDAQADLKKVIESNSFDSVNSKNQAILEADEKRTVAINQVKNAYEEAKLSYDKFMQPVSNEKATSLINRINSFLTKNTKITKDARIELQGYADELGRGVNLSRWNEINGKLKETENSMRGLNRLGRSLKDQMSQAAQSFTQWLSVSSAVMILVNQLRKMPKAVYEIDTAMTNLYKVTDETNNKYNQFLDSASKSAFKLGRSVSSLVEQTANWSKLGFSLDEAEQLAKISSIYANVGEVDNDTAVSDMVTAMKSFNIAASDSITIVDKLNKLGNEYATSAAALGDGLSRSASAMATAGTNIDKTLAMLTGGTEITQNASEFGNFLKIGSMRIRGMKGELEALGEEVDETVDSISKVQTQILNRTGGKVNIFDDIGNFRDYYDIMKDISEVYNDLSDPDKADLTEILFGKQRGNQGAALIQAFQSGQIQKALEATMNAEGSAMQEQERWLESLEAKTQQFEAAFQSLSSTVLDSDLLKWFVDFGTGVVSVLDTVIDKFGTLNTAGIIGGGIAGANNWG